MKRTSSTRRTTNSSHSEGSADKIALTLKVERETYLRLNALAVRGDKLRSHQEILLAALKDYLDRHHV